MNKRLLKGWFIASTMAISAVSLPASAQLSDYLGGVKLLVNSPASLGGTRANTNNIGSTTWNVPTLTPFFNVLLVKAVDSLACPGTLTNGTGSVPSLVDKVALIYRGNCQFGEKALEAQNFGAKAVIIVNNVPGDPAGMAGGNQGMNVTIPVFMISQADGDALNSAIIGGQDVYVSSTTWGFNFAHDLAWADNSAPPPHALAMPFNQFNSGSEQPRPYRLYNGGFPVNVGTSDELDIVLESKYEFTPNGGSATLVWKDTVTVDSFKAVDSVLRVYNDRSFNNFGASNKGVLKATHTLSSNAQDEQPSDNVIVYDMNVTDTIFCKGRYDFVRNEPVVTTGIRSTQVNGPMPWGPLYFVNKGDGWRADKAKFYVTFNSTVDTTMVGQPDVFISLFQWYDVNGDRLINTGDYNNGGELRMVGQQSYVFTPTDSTGDVFTVDLVDSAGNRRANLSDSSWFWLAVDFDASRQFLGVDGKVNYSSRAWAGAVATNPVREEYYAPYSKFSTSNLTTTIGDTLKMLPFVSNFQTLDSGFYLPNGNTATPNVSMHITDKNPPVSVNEINLSASEVRVYPNPSTGEFVHVDVNYSKPVKRATFRVVNAVGATQFKVEEYNIGRRTVSLPTKALTPGLYYVVIQGEGANSVTRSFVVSK